MTPRRWLTAAAAGLAVLVMLSGCGLGGDQDQSPPTSAATVQVPVSVPATFQTQAQWSALVAVGTAPVVHQSGVAVLVPGSTATTLAVAVLDAATGKPVWTSAQFTRPATGTPVLRWTARLGHPVVLVVTTDGPKTTIRSYDFYGTGQARQPMAASTFTGSERAPTVIITDTGVLVRGAKKHPAIAWRATTGESTAYGSGPKRGKDTGVPVAVYDDGFLLAYPAGGFAFATSTGGWDSASASVAPTNVDATKGTVVSQAAGLILASWPTVTNGVRGTMLAVHNQRSGRVLATQPQVGAVPVRNPGLVVANDGAWATWGGYVFGLHGQPSHMLNLNGAAPTVVYQDVIYATGATAPIVSSPTETPSSPSTPSRSSGATPSTSGSASPPQTTTTAVAPTPSATGSPSVPSVSGPSASPTSDKPFSGMVAVDAVTGTPVGGDQDIVPVAISALSQGVFPLNTSSTATVFSIAVR